MGGRGLVRREKVLETWGLRWEEGAGVLESGVWEHGRGSCYSTQTGRLQAPLAAVHQAGEGTEPPPPNVRPRHWPPFLTLAMPGQIKGGSGAWSQLRVQRTPSRARLGWGAWSGASTPHHPRPAVRGQKLSAATGNQCHQVRLPQSPSPPRASCEPAG